MTEAMDWASLLLRWAHVMAGIAWIGTSFFFIWLDASLRRRDGTGADMAGESWMVHGGGFYRVEKFLVAPKAMPDELHWFKWEAYFTWITGFLLLVVIYYWSAEAFLIDSAKADLSVAGAIGISVGSLIVAWLAYDFLCKSSIGDNTVLLALALFALIALAAFGYGMVFPGRAAFLHVGVFIGTIMAANVGHVIIPNQRIVVADLLAGRTPDAKYGQIAKQRSLHNNYLTLPVIFMMISSHYPMTYGHPQSWVIALGVVLAGGLARHFFNVHNSGKLDWTAKAALPAAALVGLATIGFANWRPDIRVGEPVAFTEIQPIIAKNCSMCHAAVPIHEAFEAPPKGIVFDTPEDIRKYAAQIRAQTVLTDAMPLGNETEMTAEERQTLGDWIAGGAPLE
ncbi:FIG137887: membrane protein related to purine degradation [hydrothermal vent metagenome]|uniref:FIG137887: membrane protein related to purine degradation n=1 Tax=hydrothermal vent metagenome TaxID=652676 RepID=A0A3B0T5H7_9ZZZZ